MYMDTLQITYNCSHSDPLFFNFQGGSIKRPTFKNFLRTQSSSESSKSSDSSKKSDPSSECAGSPEPMNGKTSPVNLSPRFVGGSQPSSPSTRRRKFIKRHHSSTNISTAEVHEDFDRSKSEGEEDDHTFYQRTSHSTKAYSYARPPPPSYRESRNKGRAPSGSNLLLPNNMDVSPENADFNSLSEETKRRLLSFTLRSKVNEKMKQQKEASSLTSPPKTLNTAIENPQNNSVTLTIPRKLSSCSQGTTSSTSDEQMVFTEHQLSPSEARKRFEQPSNEAKLTNEKYPVKTFASNAVRRRDGSSSSSSSRNFKIYSKGDVTFSHCQQINEWMRDLALSPRGGSERGRARAKTEDLSKTMRRSSSVARTSFTQGDEEIQMKRRSLSCQDINVGDDDVVARTRTLSNSTDSSQSSDEEEDPIGASSKAFDEKLLGLMQKCKLDSRSKTELQQSKRSYQVSCPPSYRVNKTPVEKMRDIDPSSNIQRGAVNSIKSLFESGATRQQEIVKSRTSSLSSDSSASILSNHDVQRNSSSTLGDANVKRRVWESGEGSSGEGKKQWKEPEWVARERAMKNVHSGSKSTIKEQSYDNNNNLPKEAEPEMHYSRSMSLPMRDHGILAKDATPERKRSDIKTAVVKKPSNNSVNSVGSPILQRAAVKNGPVIRKVTPVSVQYKPESETCTENCSGPTWYVNHHPASKAPTMKYESQPGSRVGSLSSVKCKSDAEKRKVPVSVSQCTADSRSQAGNRPDDMLIKNPLPKVYDRSHSPPERSTVSSQETSPPTSPHFLSSPTNAGSPPINSPPKKRSSRPRRRIVSDTTRRAHSEIRQTGRILGTIVTTTNAIELSGFAIKPEGINRNSKARMVRHSDKLNNGGAHINLPRTSLAIPVISSPPKYGSPSIRRKSPGLTVPESDDSKRLSTDRTLLEQNALHIKELLDEMNTEHSLKMERQKSDTISINAQKAARNRALMRRRSLGHDNGIVLASRVPPSGVVNEGNRTETHVPRKISTVEWVGVSG